MDASHTPLLLIDLLHGLARVVCVRRRPQVACAVRDNMIQQLCCNENPDSPIFLAWQRAFGRARLDLPLRAVKKHGGLFSIDDGRKARGRQACREQA